jgi:hypothetical protein
MWHVEQSRASTACGQLLPLHAFPQISEHRLLFALLLSGRVRYFPAEILAKTVMKFSRSPLRKCVRKSCAKRVDNRRKSSGLQTLRLCKTLRITCGKAAEDRRKCTSTACGEI